ncbi:MAG TPA: fatty acid desaturase [Myxococcales bacterium]|nr:fatty acid desaturase [Myxococcales bacterium]
MALEPEPELVPPGRLNLALTTAIVLGLMTLQWGASRAATGWGVAACGVAFGFLFLPLYSLLHDAEHRVFHRDWRVNDGAGVVLAALFPGPFTFLRACHLGHHRRNRSDSERFELCYPDEALWRRRLEFYFLYLGGFWLLVPLSTVLLLVWPGAMKSSLVQDAPEAAAMVNGVPVSFVRRIRLEGLGTLALHVALILGLQLDPLRYALLYGLAGLSWSSQQYITHAGSPRDALDGAHNLRAARWYEVLLLNFNWHLAHHQHPKLSWYYLPRFDDRRRERPGYLTSFVKFWVGPKRVPRPS